MTLDEAIERLEIVRQAKGGGWQVAIATEDEGKRKRVLSITMMDRFTSAWCADTCEALAIPHEVDQRDLDGVPVAGIEVVR